MRKKGINFESKSKLTDFVTKKTQAEEETILSGLVQKKNPEARTRSFRLRPQDFDDLWRVKNAVNSSEDIYRLYNDTDILRGMINMVASNPDIKKLLNHVKKVQ
ncbi:MAG: hypothetical protein K0R02_690 [Rickettsiaceae bacterium]|jgi:hypothetical protein|nr:hypothetical protein [Rickettsiaceae bacterium]